MKKKEDEEGEEEEEEEEEEEQEEEQEQEEKKIRQTIINGNVPVVHVSIITNIYIHVLAYQTRKKKDVSCSESTEQSFTHM